MHSGVHRRKPPNEPMIQKIRNTILAEPQATYFSQVRNWKWNFGWRIWKSGDIKHEHGWVAVQRFLRVHRRRRPTVPCGLHCRWKRFRTAGWPYTKNAQRNTKTFSIFGNQEPKQKVISQDSHYFTQILKVDKSFYLSVEVISFKISYVLQI